jgi:hypothetical protein
MKIISGEFKACGGDVVKKEGCITEIMFSITNGRQMGAKVHERDGCPVAGKHK